MCPIGNTVALYDSTAVLFTLNLKKMRIKSVPEYYIWVCDYGWPFKAAAISHAKSFEDGIWRWNPIVNKYEVFRPEYSK